MDQHVSVVTDQRPQTVHLSPICEIDRDPALGAVEGVKRGGGIPGKRRAPAAAGVTPIRVLDFDDFGTELAKDHPGIGCGDAVTDFDHGETEKWASARHETSLLGPLLISIEGGFGFWLITDRYLKLGYWLTLLLMPPDNAGNLQEDTPSG